MKNILYFLLYLWQLPQNLAGLIFVSIMYNDRTGFYIDFKGPHPELPSSRIFLSDRMRGGITLGRYVVLALAYSQDYNAWAHECGHSIQSMILGPLYLLIIGIPSLIWAAWWNNSRGVSYYSFYTERWADRLGGVTRC